MYLTMSWAVEGVFSVDSNESVEFDSVPYEWQESDLDKYLDAAILLHGVKGDRVILNEVDAQLVCQVRFMVPNDCPVEMQQLLVEAVVGGLHDGFGENGLVVHGREVYLELNLAADPVTRTEPGPTAMATLAVLASAGEVDTFRARLQAAKSDGTFDSAMQSTLETLKPLALAVGSGSVEKVQLLLDAGANPNGDEHENPPIASTALVNSQCLPDDKALEMAERLVAAGARVQNPLGLAKKARSRGKSKLAAYFASLGGN